MALGDVITIRGGTTVEVINTDAEGRLVMADALVLATEERVDAIVDIATLTGACMRALGTQVAGVMGNNDGLVDQVEAAADATDEPVWQLPLDIATATSSTRRSPTCATSAAPTPARSRPPCSWPSSSATPRGPTSTSPARRSRPATPAGRPPDAPGSVPDSLLQLALDFDERGTS